MTQGCSAVSPKNSQAKTCASGHRSGNPGRSRWGQRRLPPPPGRCVNSPRARPRRPRATP
eukprot:9481665-Pyramimonas_sp.AAC.1